MSIEITEPTTFPSDDPANSEMKEHRKAYLVSFDPQLLVDRIILLEERVWHAQRVMTIMFDYPDTKRTDDEKNTKKQMDKCTTS